MYYDHNIQVLKEYRRTFYELLQGKQHIVGDIELKVDSIATRVEEKALIIEKQGIQFRLNSKYNPIEEAENWAKQFYAKNLDTVFTMFGLGSGCFVRALAKKLNHESRLLVFEPSLDIFLHVLHEYDLEDIIKNDNILIIVKDINEYELPYLVAATLTWMNLYSNKTCVHPSYDTMFEESYSMFVGVIEDNAFNNVVSMNTYEKLAKSIVKNSLINLAHFRESISIWDLNKKLPKNVPVIIAAAGPSLLKNIDELKKAKGHAIIVAVDRAYEAFIRHGIEPDFVIVLDAMKPLKHCGNVPGFTVPLLYQFEASPEILGNHNGKKIIYGYEDFIGNIYQMLGMNCPKIKTGGSVTTAAFAVFAVLGFERIVLMGCDMAYEGEKSHAGEEQDELTDDYRAINLYVEDIYGNQVKTRHDWYTFLRWFEGVIVQLKDADIIDATEGGAKIKGTRIIPIREVIEKYCNEAIDCRRIVEETEATITSDDCDAIYRYLITASEDLMKIRKLSRKALKSSSALEKNINAGNRLTQYQNDLKSISDINETIETKPIYALIDYYVYGQGTTNINQLFFMTNKEETDDLIAVKNMTHIYQIICDACDFLEPKLLEVIPCFKTVP